MLHDGTVTISFTRIDNGAKVVLAYDFEGGPDSDYPNSMIVDDDKTAADDPVTLLVNESITTEVSAFADANKLSLITTTVGVLGAPEAATSVTGGNIRPRAGSGTLTFKTDQVEAGDDVDLTLIYEAATALNNVTLEIVVNGIQLTDDDVNVKPDIASLQKGTAGDYGYVSGSGTDSDPQLTLTDADGDGPTEIRWAGLTFTEAGDKFTTTIEDVRIQEEGGNVTFISTIGGQPLAKSPILYITDTADAAVEFTITAADATPSVVDGTFASFSAAQEVDLLTFKFKAKTTSIKGGQVRFTLPSNWTKAVKPLKDNAIKEQGQLVVTGGGTTEANRVDNVSISGQRVTVKVPELAKGMSITIAINAFTDEADEIDKKVTVQSNATEEDEYETITGLFWTSSSIGGRVSGRGHNAGAVDIEITNAADGYGTATISPSSVKAGSDDQEITVDFKAVGTMDGGAVRLVTPPGWGTLQDDDATEANYIEVDVRGRGTATANVGSNAAIAYPEGLVKGSVVRFTYGGGTVLSRNGAEVQPSIAVADPAKFIIETDGDGDSVFAKVRGTQRTKAAIKVTTDAKTIPLGTVYRDRAGELRVEVTGADDGSGTAEVAIVNTAKGEAMYPDDEDLNSDGDKTELVDSMRIHAGDMGTYLMFTYTPSQTIQNGQLIFEAPGEWTDPQNDPGTAGYTYVDGTGTSDIDHIEFDEDDGAVTVDIGYIDPDGTVEIHYGAYEGEDDGSGAHAPTSATSSSAFTVEVKGGSAKTNKPVGIKTAKGKSIAVRVYSQASGGGDAMASVSDNIRENVLGAGDMGREVTIVYTAAGQISGGSLKLTVPGNWSYPTMDNVAISSTGTINRSSALYGGAYVGDPDDATDDDFPVDADDVALLGDMDVTVDGVNLAAGKTVTFVYSAAMVQATIGDAPFTVAVDGGSGPGEGPADITVDPSDALTVSVGDASAGSGMGMVEVAQAVIVDSTGNTLTFIYTPVGEITDRSLDFRVKVPTGWSEPTDSIDTDAKGSFTVTQKQLGADKTLKELTPAAMAVEKIGPFDRQIAARLEFGQSVQAGDQIIFNYENANAPSTIGDSTFVMYFGEEQVTMDTDLSVPVGSGKVATALMVDVSADMILMEDDESVTVTVELKDEDGNAVPATEDMDVDLESSSATSSFMVDGVEMDVVTIMASSSSAMADYTDSTLGEATITASSGTLTDGEATVTVTTDLVELTSATVTPTLAKVGDTVTVGATGTAGKTPMYSVLNADGIGVQPSAMTEDEAGSYSDMFDVVVDHHPDGMYTVTVTLNGETETVALTIDSTAPTITAPSASPEMVANGEMVTISAMVDGATSVMADVSMLDTEAASVALTDADGDGTYIGMHTISDKNGADNGTHTITVTAMDAAGNISDPATAMVMLQNTLSFTSTLPAGISLFHVPLDVEGLDTVGDLEAKLGDNVNLLITYDGTSWNSRSDDVMITATLGILVSMAAETMVTFEGNAWADSSVTLAAGSNLIGLPVNDPNVTMISDIIGLFSANTVSSVIVASGGEFQVVAAAGDAADGPVAGDAAYLVVATAAGSAMLSGDGWMNGNASAAPIALAGYTVDNQTPVLDVHGSVVDEITGLAREGFRVKVKNLSTKAALSNITSAEAAEGYNIIFVDLADSYAARVGDVLEISAETPDPLIGVKPVRHIVTVDDVKNSTIQLEELIAYEIPAETELLRNYPNPFNPETWIPYRLAEDADVSLTIYDTSGALVRSIDIGHQTAAVYETRAKAIYWDGRNQFGEQVASGLYFYHLSAGDDFSGTRRMVILK